MGKTKREARVVGVVRAELAAELGARYDSGASIRELAEQTGRSYGFVHRLLVDADVTLRGRGGNTRKKKEPPSTAAVDGPGADPG
jgi:predicted transcriptional regulator